MIETLEKSRAAIETEELERAYSLPVFNEQRVYDREMRAYHDATTWLAETLDGRMLTTFEYDFDGEELYASDGGALKPIFEKSLEDAEESARRNPSLEFELRRRAIELDEYGDMVRMARGELPNTMITVSDFPPELMYSSRDVGGYNTHRKQTMLRVITRMPDGRLRMRSQSLDGSNRQALEAIYASFGHKPEPGELLGQRIYHQDNDETEQEFLVDKLAGVYDHSLEAQNPGRQYRAGRLLPDNPGTETYGFVRSQPDLVNLLKSKMLANELDEATMYSVAATMARRYENGGKTNKYYVAGEVINVAMTLDQEMFVAASQARAENKVFSGCGASIGASGELGADGQLEAGGFGNKAGEDKFGPLKFKCQNGHENTRPHGKLIDKCTTCGISVKC